ncbi:MAG: type II toxin-antitoxin system RelE/ParE family toxin [Pontiella sp.]
MKKITFYTTGSGKCPIEDHLDKLSVKQIAWVLKNIREMSSIPANYFKKPVNTDDIWAARVDVGRDTFRLLGFFDGSEWIILTNSFQKKTQKTPPKEIKLAEQRKKKSPAFAKDFDKGYEQFRIGVMLKQARLEAGLTQEQVAEKLHTHKSAISRIENHAEDIRLSTLESFAQAVGKPLRLEVA